MLIWGVEVSKLLSDTGSHYFGMGEEAVTAYMKLL